MVGGDEATFRRALPILKYRGRFVLQQPDEAWFDLSMLQMDLLLALEMGRELAAPCPRRR